MDQRESNHKTTYHIKVKGTLLRPIAEMFSDIMITPKDNSETLFVGEFVDQPALRGFLDQLWNLNFTILSLERIEDETTK